MNIETMKGMITVIADLGEGATAAVDSIVLLMILSKLANAALGMFLIAAIIYTIKWVVTKVSENDSAHERLKSLRDEANIGYSGTLTQAEFNEMLRLIHKGKEK